MFKINPLFGNYYYFILMINQKYYFKGAQNFQLNYFKQFKYFLTNHYFFNIFNLIFLNYY